MANPRRYVPLVGIVACLLLLGGLAVPFFFASGNEVGLYYDSGALNPMIAGLFAVVAIVVFAAGRENRTDPALAAGVALTLGVFAVVVVVPWALTVRVDVLANATLSAHPTVLAVLAVFLPVSAAWYARSLGIF